MIETIATVGAFAEFFGILVLFFMPISQYPKYSPDGEILSMNVRKECRNWMGLVGAMSMFIGWGGAIACESSESGSSVWFGIGVGGVFGAVVASVVTQWAIGRVLRDVAATTESSHAMH